MQKDAYEDKMNRAGHTYTVVFSIINSEWLAVRRSLQFKMNSKYTKRKS